MELTLFRTKYDDLATEGALYDSSGFLCFTLELPFTDGLAGSAIVEARFAVALLPSPKFDVSSDPWVLRYAKLMPHLMDVPNRTAIMIHWGDFVKNTEGCILVGKSQGDDFIGSSRDAFEALYELLQGPALAGECFLTVKRDLAA